MRNLHCTLITLVILAAMLSGRGIVASQDAPVLFRDIRGEAGITYAHRSAPEKKFISESMSGGMALFDYDNDGLVDMYFVDALTVDTAHDPKLARKNLSLYQKRHGISYPLLFCGSLDAANVQKIRGRDTGFQQRSRSQSSAEDSSRLSIQLHSRRGDRRRDVHICDGHRPRSCLADRSSRT